jgi:hypothetical protein
MDSDTRIGCSTVSMQLRCTHRCLLMKKCCQIKKIRLFMRVFHCMGSSVTENHVMQSYGSLSEALMPCCLSCS